MRSLGKSKRKAKSVFSTPKNSSQKASMLIVALGVLTLLSVLAVTFATVMMLEHQAAKNYSDSVQANFLAQSGKEATIAYLQQSLTDPNTLSKQKLSERYPWLYNLGNYSLTLERAMRDPQPEKFVSFYKSLGAMSYPGGLDRYGVKIIDTNSQININNVFEPRVGNTATIDTIMKRLLVNLGKAVQKAQNLPRSPLPESDVIKILKYRDQLENRSFASKEQLLDVISEENYLKIKDFITTQSWVDPHAVYPNTEANVNDPFAPVGSLPKIGFKPGIARSPININTASPEVLTAVLTGIGGRTVFTFNDLDIVANRQVIDFQAPKWKTTDSRRYEETQIRVASMFVWIEPLSVEEAYLIAKEIIKYRQTVGVFDNFFEFSRFLDTILNANSPIFSAYYNRTNRNGNPSGLTNQRIKQEVADSPLVARNPFTQSGMNLVLKNLINKGLRDAIRANFNPNSLVSALNPNEAAYRVVDKANLWYQPIKTGSKYPKPILTQTTEFCFQPMGIFEITSLGQVKSSSGIEAEAKLRTLVSIFEAVRHTTQFDFEKNAKVFGDSRDPNSTNPQRVDITTYPEHHVNWKVVTNTTFQPYHMPKDPKTNQPRGGLPSGSLQEDADLDIIDGRVELNEAADSSSRGKNGATLQARWNSKDQDYSSFNAQVRTGRDDIWGYAYENLTSLTDARLVETNETVQTTRGNLQPDGFYNTKYYSSYGASTTGKILPRYIWYRAGYYDDQSPEQPLKPGRKIEQGQYARDVYGGIEPNLDYYRGVVEFWYKPDKNWQFWEAYGAYERPLATNFYNRGALDIFMGFLYISHVRAKRKDKSLSTGTQLFVYRSVFGDLKATRIYYEILGENPNVNPNAAKRELPYIEYATTDKIKKYLKSNQGSADKSAQKALADGKIVGLKEYIEAYKIDPVENGGTFRWPPDEIGATNMGQIDSNIRRARSDCIIYSDSLRGIRAHQWHHFSITWNDTTTNPNARLSISIDNGMIRSIPLPRLNDAKFNGAFVKLNEIPYRNRDAFYIGSIFREQYFPRSGVFKFVGFQDLIKEVCHGTIDDVYCYTSSTYTPSTPRRFADSGIYVNAFNLRDKFSGGVQALKLGTISWTGYLPFYWCGGDTRFLANPYQPYVIWPKIEIFQVYLQKFNPSTQQLEGSIRPILIDPSVRALEWNNYKKSGIAPLVDNTGKPITAGPNDWLVYKFRLQAGTPRGGRVRNIATPVLDDVTLTFFRPQPKILLETIALR
ncbi:MAG: hypothetical protein D6805_09420 [Planctomycetota bacterium]|nr:MAG: hypothetical protein D6805_09420 [Planctomycetota bacterium]